MKNKSIFTLFSLFLLAFFLFITCTRDVAVSELPEGYMPFPPGFDYPQNRDSIDSWVSDENVESIRTHAWSMFAGLNQKANGWKRVWQTWHPIGEVFPQKDSIVESPILEPAPPDTIFPTPVANPKSYCFENGNLFFFTSYLLVGSTFYNKEAADWIAGKQLGSKAKLDTFYKAGRKNIPEAPPKAMIMKNIYWPVSGRESDYSPLPLWDGSGDRNPLGYNGFETWERAVAVTCNQNPPEGVDVEWLYGYANREDYFYKYENIKPVGLDQFYYIKLDKEVIAEFTAIDSCIVNNSFVYVFNRNFEEGDYLVCVAQHLMTKEISNWTMQTIWWHDKPNEGMYAEDRPSDISPGPWQHYLMSQAYYMSTPNEPGGENHIGFNPYIELTLPEQNRINSNCQNCHIRAGYPELEGAFFIADPIGGPVKFPEQPTAHYHTLREGFIGPGDTIFNEIMRTDFNWSVADRAK